VRYIISRLLLIPPTVLLVMVVVFVALRVVPGDVVSVLVRDQNVTPEAARDLRRRLGLDDPLPVQFLRYLGDLARGDLGESLWTGRPVWDELRLRAPVTLQLALMASAFTLAGGLLLGTVAASRRGGVADRGIRLFTVAGLALPGFWLGTLAVVLPALWWGYSPPLTYVSPVSDPWGNLRQFVPPALLMSVFYMAVLVRVTRTSLLGVLGSPYIRTATAKGLTRPTVLRRHALRAGLIAPLTVFGGQFALLLGGSVVFEQVFNLKGVGSYLFQAVSQRDYPVVQSLNVLLAVAVLSVNATVDLAYAALDPRIRRR
jgi:peptide/nickel transport system permease protein